MGTLTSACTRKEVPSAVAHSDSCSSERPFDSIVDIVLLQNYSTTVRCKW